MPIRQAVRESCTSDAVACRSRLILGSAGRYMSMQSGPKIDRPPTRIRNRAVGDPFEVVNRADSASTWAVETFVLRIGRTYRAAVRGLVVHGAALCATIGGGR